MLCLQHNNKTHCFLANHKLCKIDIQTETDIFGSNL